MPINPYVRWFRGLSMDRHLDLEAVLDDHVEALDHRLRVRALGEIQHWELDQDRGTLRLEVEPTEVLDSAEGLWGRAATVFSGPPADLDDLIVLEAPMQIIGSHDGATFRWAWANDSVDERLAAHSRQAKEALRIRGYGELTAETLKISPEDAWALTALAWQHTRSTAAYVGRSGWTLVFMTHGEWSREPGPARVEVDAFDAIRSLLQLRCSYGSSRRADPPVMVTIRLCTRLPLR